MKKSGLLPLIFPVLLFCSCRLEIKNDEPGKVNREIMAADIAFSDMSKEQGMKSAFLAFIDSTGVLLRPNQLPIVGSLAAEHLQQINDSSFVLTWKPDTAYAAASADMGYSYGVYSLKIKGGDTMQYGTYVTIWKKQEDGSWKFVLDSGNEGTGQK